jgi:hypothetical protein
MGMEVIHPQIFRMRILLVFISLKKETVHWRPDEQSLEIFSRRNRQYSNDTNEAAFTSIFSGFYTYSTWVKNSPQINRTIKKICYEKLR